MTCSQTKTTTKLSYLIENFFFSQSSSSMEKRKFRFDLTYVSLKAHLPSIYLPGKFVFFMAEAAIL